MDRKKWGRVVASAKDKWYTGRDSSRLGPRHERRNRVEQGGDALTKKRERRRQNRNRAQAMDPHYRRNRE